MNLIELAPKAGTQDAYSIRANDLDSNFRKLRPVHNGQYGIDEKPNGWSLNVFPQLPEKSSISQALAYKDGTKTWISISDLLSELADGDRIAVQEIERCDGKKMKVLGTVWY